MVTDQAPNAQSAVAEVVDNVSITSAVTINVLATEVIFANPFPVPK